MPWYSKTKSGRTRQHIITNTEKRHGWVSQGRVRGGVNPPQGRREEGIDGFWTEVPLNHLSHRGLVGLNNKVIDKLSDKLND